MKKILIIGATGFIGKSLTNLLSKDCHIIAYDKYIPTEVVRTDIVEYVLGNFTTENRFVDLLQGVDVVVHLACSSVPYDDTSVIEQEIKDNVIPTIRLLEALKDRPSTRLVFASSAGTVYGETGDIVNTANSATAPTCSYGVQKVVIENYIQFYGRRYGLNYAIMRMSNPYGVGQDSNKVQGLIPILIRQILNNKGITIYGDGGNLRDYVYLPELTEGIMKVISYPGPERIFNLGLGKYYSINDVVSAVEEITQKTFMDKSYVKKRFCDLKKSIVDYESSQIELNWHPSIDLYDGIRLTYNTMKLNPNEE